MNQTDYRLEIIGGPYDGAPGMAWTADDDHPVPERIWLGRCSERFQCGQRMCPGRSHVAYWSEVEGERPTDAIVYERESVEYMTLAGEGVARYVMGQLDGLGPREVAEAVPAGAMARALVALMDQYRHVSRRWEDYVTSVSPIEAGYYRGWTAAEIAADLRRRAGV